MKKSTLFLVLVLLVSVFLLTACNSAQGGEGGNTNAAVTGDENLTAGSENATFAGITTPDEPIGGDEEQNPTIAGTTDPGETTATEPGETTATEPGETTATEPGETASPTEPEPTKPSANTPGKPIELPDVPF